MNEAPLVGGLKWFVHLPILKKLRYQLSTFDAEFKFAINPKFLCLGGGWGWWNQLSTFDAEFKFAKI